MNPVFPLGDQLKNKLYMAGISHFAWYTHCKKLSCGDKIGNRHRREMMPCVLVRIKLINTKNETDRLVLYRQVVDIW